MLSRLNSLLEVWKSYADNSPHSELTWLTLTSILRECSPVGTAQRQYVLPTKIKKRVVDPFAAFESKVDLIFQDMVDRQKEKIRIKARQLQEDARTCSYVPDKWADLIITSPPYANNYDYADATRLEMNFLGEIDKWGDLQNMVRRYLVRSCTQHVASCVDETYRLSTDPLLKPIQTEILHVCEQLKSEREKHGGKKPYHTMIAAYFNDMAHVWKALRRVTAQNSLVCFVIGDSAPYGIHVPVEKWFGELALSLGFKSYTFQKLRDRNIKWENRKHKVPLHEGLLWINA